MFISKVDVLHPNVVKHTAELVSEKILSANVYDDLCAVNFEGEKDGVRALKDFLVKKNVSSTAINMIINNTITELYSYSNPYMIIAKYIYTSKVRKAILRHVSKFNNNKNYNFNIDAIIAEFEKFVLASPLRAYNFDTNSPVKFLVFTFGLFGKSINGKQFIYSILNERGSQVSGEDGEMSLSDLAANTVETYSHSIDFPKVVKDIYEASNALFTISGIVCYDIFSYYMDKELRELKEEVKGIFSDVFNSDSIGPIVVSNDTSYESETDFRRNTIIQRVKILEQIKDNLDSSLEFDRVNELYSTVISMDARNLSHSNVGRLFKHKQSGLQHNYTVFFKILKGLVSLEEFMKYLKLNKIKLAQEDYKLFRDPSLYRRFNTLEDYISLRDITSAVITEGNTLQDSVPYLTNDQCYEAMQRRDYNLISLSSVVKMEMNRNMSEFRNIDEYVKNINSSYQVCSFVYSNLVNVHNAMISVGLDPFDHEVFDAYFSSSSEVELEYLDVLIYPNDEMLRRSVIESKDIGYILRFLNLRIVYFQHILSLLDKINNDLEYVILTIDKNLLSFPKFISSLEDASKLVSTLGISFHLDEKVDKSIVNSMIFKKQYYLMSYSIYEENSKLYDFISEWIEKVISKSEEYGITLTKKKLPKSLREKSIFLQSMPYVENKNFELFKNKFSVIDGFLYDKGKLLEYDRCYIHEKGYFLLMDNNYQIIEIKENQTFY